MNYTKMYKNIGQGEFIDAFRGWDTYKDKYSYNGLVALFEYFEELEAGTGEEVELDVVAIACDFTEYGSAWEAMEEYQPEDMPTVDLDEVKSADGGDLSYAEVNEAQEEEALKWLEDRTTVIKFEGGIIIQNF